MKNKYQICSRCVMDTSDPNINFDNNGVCDHCHNFDAYVLPYWDTGEGGKQKLVNIIDNIKNAGANNDYDCIMGMSGGADSSYMLHKVVTEFKLRPLVFHVDAGWNSQIAVNNIQRVVNKLNLVSREEFEVQKKIIEKMKKSMSGNKLKKKTTKAKKS